MRHKPALRTAIRHRRDDHSVGSAYDFSRVVTHSRVVVARRAVDTCPRTRTGRPLEGGMTTPRSGSGILARSARGLVALTAGLTFLAVQTPVAYASPIGDADNAITAA